jgi:hypothetical protein
VSVLRPKLRSFHPSGHRLAHAAHYFVPKFQLTLIWRKLDFFRPLLLVDSIQDRFNISHVYLPLIIIILSFWKERRE